MVGPPAASLTMIKRIVLVKATGFRLFLEIILSFFYFYTSEKELFKLSGQLFLPIKLSFTKSAVIAVISLETEISPLKVLPLTL